MATRLAWILEGVRTGVVTTPYPRRVDAEATAGVRSHPALVAERCQAAAGCDACARACLPAAITVTRKSSAKAVKMTLDTGRCIGCALCVAACPYDALVMSSGDEPATRAESALALDAQVAPVAGGPKSHQ